MTPQPQHETSRENAADSHETEQVEKPERRCRRELRCLGSLVLEVDAVITGVVREYGSVRSGAASANVISVSLQMIEINSGQIIWSASSTKGGVKLLDRLFGGGGKPMDTVTVKAVDDLLDKLFD